MTAIALKSMAERKLRSALTAIAILLGVAMIAGTYVQTDQIRTAFDDIEQTAYQGVDVNIAAKSEFSGDFAPPQPVSERLVAQVAAVPGVAKAAGELFESGALVVDGKLIQPQFAPAIVTSQGEAPFSPLTVASGRFARGNDE